MLRVVEAALQPAGCAGGDRPLTRRARRPTVPPRLLCRPSATQRPVRRTMEEWTAEALETEVVDAAAPAPPSLRATVGLKESEAEQLQWDPDLVEILEEIDRRCVEAETMLADFQQEVAVREMTPGLARTLRERRA